MPYVFAHPAAAVPLHVLLGRSAVPSALVIGSIAPDLWYLLYLVDREHAHSVPGLFWFCLPAGLLLYTAFHRLFKEPILALMPALLAARLASWTCRSLPRVPWRAVVVSLLAGSIAHLAWDALTHSSVLFVDRAVIAIKGYDLQARQLLQHGSTLLGSAFLAGWLWRKLRARPAARPPGLAVLPMPLRAVILAALLFLSIWPFWHVAFDVPASKLADVILLRGVLRGGATSGLSALGLALLAYCLLWRWHAAVHHRASHRQELRAFQPSRTAPRTSP